MYVCQIAYDFNLLRVEWERDNGALINTNVWWWAQNKIFMERWMSELVYVHLKFNL